MYIMYLPARSVHYHLSPPTTELFPEGPPLQRYLDIGRLLSSAFSLLS